MKRSTAEIIFLFLFLPLTIGFYLIYKYPTWFVPQEQVVSSFYWFGKSTGFWYSTLYTAIVCILAAKVFIRSKAVYGKNKKKPLSKYQRNKFISIFVSQLIFFYAVPYLIPAFTQEGGFFNDQFAPVYKDNYIYMYRGFTSWGGAAYLFVVIPLAVWFFGKRYCSWFCACGNLAETIGITEWGNKWVVHKTPRGETSEKLEVIQYIILGFSLVFGIFLLLDITKILIAGAFVQSMRAFQDLAIDLLFGALIGVGAYPFLGTRVWCRYGCALAGAMRLYGKFTKSKFQVVANNKCRGLDLCTTQCPMGIDVASYAHKDKQPIEGSFGLENSPCIGCGGCIDICPVQALSFKEIMGPKEKSKVG